MNEFVEKLFNKDYVFFNNANQRIAFYEKEKNGIGYAYFTSTNNTIIIKVNNKNPIFWCTKNNFQRSDGAFFILDTNNKCLSLHLLEMKMRLKKDTFITASEQIRSMYLLSLGIIAMLGLEIPNHIVAYIAYSENLIDNYLINNPASNKIPLGSNTDPVIENWNKKIIPLYHGKTAKLVLGKRSNDGNGNFNCDFGMV